MVSDDVHHDPAPPDLPPPGLPGIRPLDPADWFRADGPFAARMALREELMATRRDQVIAALPGAEALWRATLARVIEALDRHPAWRVDGEAVVRPDGVRLGLDGDPAEAIARLVQEDVIVMDRGPDGTHRLVAAVLLFPAGWTLAEKLGRPLMAIHSPFRTTTPPLARGCSACSTGSIRTDRWSGPTRWPIPRRTSSSPGPKPIRSTTTSRNRGYGANGSASCRLARAGVRRSSPSAPISSVGAPVPPARSWRCRGTSPRGR